MRLNGPLARKKARTNDGRPLELLRPESHKFGDSATAPWVRRLSLEEIAPAFRGKTVAIVGSAPSVLANDGRYIDGHDFVVRVNNYKTRGMEAKTGARTDIHYSFYGASIKKRPQELKQDGVTLCMCKCPDAHAIQSEWHDRNGARTGVDWRWIYKMRAPFWFVPYYVPTTDHFLRYFDALEKHVPTTGMQCIMEFMQFGCASLYITGFDFFSSGLHNVNERWKAGRSDDPHRHRPDLELRWLRDHMTDNVRFDPTLEKLLRRTK